MGKGQLFASVCALGLLAAVPAWAANNGGADTGTSSSTGANVGDHGTATMGNGGTSSTQGSTNTGRSTMSSGSSTSDNSMSSGSPSSTSPTGNTHRWSSTRGARSAHSSQTDNSQNAEVDRLNQQSLQAAEQGRSFDMGSANNSSGNVGTTSSSRMGSDQTTGAPGATQNGGMPSSSGNMNGMGSR